MPVLARVSGSWKGAAAFVRVGGAWKAANAFVRVGGAWKSAAVQKVATPQTYSVAFPGAPGDMTAYVTVTCATSGATLYASLSGGAWFTFSGTIQVPPGTSLRVYATKAGYTDSDILGPFSYA